jgi:hypothetical protein
MFSIERMCNVYMKLDPVQKPVWKFLSLKKKCDKTETQGFKIWKNQVQTLTRKTST